jgi:tripartite-type tricarboxylate transporter receptor subunit TctC
MGVVFAKYGMARPFFTAPGVPSDRLALLRRAFDATMSDPVVIAEAKKLGMELSPVRGEDVEALVAKMMATPDKLAARARDVLKPR